MMDERQAQGVLAEATGPQVFNPHQIIDPPEVAKDAQMVDPPLSEWPQDSYPSVPHGCQWRPTGLVSVRP